ncbi:tol-pal system YbgF family protein [Fibrobacterota bacterium]
MMTGNLMRCLLPAACLVFSCAKQAVRKPLMDDVVFESDQENGKQSASRLNSRLVEIDSLEASSEKAEALYLVALDNFINAGVEDERLPRMIMGRGDYYFERALYAQAVENYRLIIEQYQNTIYYVEAMKQIALAFARDGEFENAEIWYRKLRKQGSDSLKKETRSSLAGSLFRKARDYEKKNQYHDAGELYLRIAKRYPDVGVSPDALFAAGMMEEKKGNLNEAIRLYRRFIKKFYESPLVPRVLYQEAECWGLSKAYKKAAKKHLNVIRSFPASPEAESSLLKAALAFENANQLTIAARTYEKFAELYSGNRDACDALTKAENLFKGLNLKENLKRVRARKIERCPAGRTSKR